MWLLLLQTLCSGLSLATLLILLWVSSEYIRAKRQIQNLLCKFCGSLRHIMQMDDMIDELLAEETTEAQCVPATKQPKTANPVSATRRERLATIAAGGLAKQYLGKAWTVEEIDSLSEDEVMKLYARYEARLGATMTKTIGRIVLQLYTSAASILLPIPPENRHLLIEDLESDPFVAHALNCSACDLFHRYGMCLAPLTAMLTTIKYCQFGHQCPIVDTDDGEEQDDDSNRGQPSGSGDCCGGHPSGPRGGCGETSA